MTPARLLEIWKQPDIISEKETEVLESFTRNFPYFNLPYIILSKVYKDKEDFRFDDMMRHASIRCKNRKELYDYLHQSDLTIKDSNFKAEKAKQEILLQENKELSVNSDIAEIIDSESILTKTETQVPETPKIIKVKPAEKKEPKKKTISPDVMEPVTKDIPEKEFSEEVIEKSPEIKINPDLGKNRLNKKIEEKITISPDVVEPVTNKTHVKESSEKIIEKVPEIKVEPVISKSKLKEKTAEKHTFEEWLNEFSHANSKISVTEIKPKAENIRRDRPVFKPKKKNNAPEAIALIEEFIEKSPSISKPKTEFFKAETAAKKSLEMDFSIATETLANLLVKQGHFDQAKEVYQKLMLKFPEKERYFAGLIEKLTINNE